MSRINVKYLDFMLNLFFEMNERGNLLEIRYDGTGVSRFGEILFKYNNKIGLPFVSRNEGNMVAIDSLLKYLNTNYVEFKSLFNKSDNLAGLSDYMLYKIEMYFGLIYDIEINTFLDLLSFFNIIIYMHSIKSISSEFGDIYNEINNLIDQLYNKLVNDNILNNDLIEIVTYILNKELIKINEYSNYSSYVLDMYSESIDLIKNFYGLPTETIEIFKVAQNYLEGIESGILFVHPYLGDVYNYINLLTKIFLNEKIDVLLRLSAGESLHNILVGLTLFNDYSSYLKLINISEYYSDFILSNIDIINKDAKYIGIHDSARILVLLLTMADYNIDKVTFSKIYKKIEDITRKYNLTPYKIILEWKSYMRDANEDHIKEIYKIHKGINYSDYDYIEPQIKMLGTISTLIMDNEDKINYDLAVTYNEDSFFNADYIEKLPIANYIMYNDLICIIFGLKNMIKNRKFTEINNLKKHIYSFNEKSGKKELLKHLIYKTQILIDLINENYGSMNKRIEEIQELVDSKNVDDFCNTIINWKDDYTNLTGRSFILTKYIDKLNSIDPWYVFLREYIVYKMKLDLENNVINYDAILFVEGKTDLNVFDEIISNLYPNKNVLIKDIEGYTNLTIFYKEMGIIVSFNVPIYCIFDGDTKKDNKMKRVTESILNNYSNDKVSIYVLNKNTIEDYLLDPKIIKISYPQIIETDEDLNKLFESKKNKKALLSHLFRRISIKYNSDVARSIATNISKESLDAELKDVLNKMLGEKR